MTEYKMNNFSPHKAPHPNRRTKNTHRMKKKNTHISVAIVRFFFSSFHSHTWFTHLLSRLCRLFFFFFCVVVIVVWCLWPKRWLGDISYRYIEILSFILYPQQRTALWLCNWKQWQQCRWLQAAESNNKAPKHIIEFESIIWRLCAEEFR